MSLDPDHVSAREAIDRILADFRREIYTSFPARVVRYYPDLGTVDVEPAVKCEVPGFDHEELLFEDLGELVSLPIAWPRAGGFVITFPIQPGDWVAVHCSVQSTLVWRGTGQVHEHPGVSDPHGLNGCFVVPGCHPDVQRVQNVSTTDLVIGKEDGSAVIRMQPSGAVRIESSDVVAGNGPAPQEVALAQLVEQAISNAIATHTHSVPGIGNSATGVPSGPVQSTAAKQLKTT
jgi:hypothetical protein